MRDCKYWPACGCDSECECDASIAQASVPKKGLIFVAAGAIATVAIITIIVVLAVLASLQQ